MLLVATSAAVAGDVARGRALLASRASTCTLCHALPFTPPGLEGDVGPDLRGVGARLGLQALRERIANPALANPATLMPAFGSPGPFIREAAAFEGKPILTPEQVDDAAAYLATLK